MPAYNETSLSQKTTGAIPGDNPMLQLSQAHERAIALCNRVDALCDRMLGGSPMTEPQPTVPDEPNVYGGVIGGVVTDTRALNARLYFAEEALTRIEQIVGPL